MSLSLVHVPMTTSEIRPLNLRAYLMLADRIANDCLGRSMDMIMLALHNSREREEKEWIALFAKVDERFRFQSAKVMEGTVAAVMVFEWRG